MKKQHLTSLQLNKKSISNFNTNTLTGGRITWENSECRTDTKRTDPVKTQHDETCLYYSCVVCDA